MADSTDPALSPVGGGDLYAPTDIMPAQGGGGFAGGLMAALGHLDPNLLIHVGAGIMSGARYGSNLGEGLMMGMQSYQQSRQAGQQYQMGQLDLTQRRMMYGLMQQGLQGGGQPQQAQGPSDPYAPVTPQQIYSAQVPGMLPPQLGWINSKDPAAFYQSYRDQQLKLAQMQHQQTLGKLDTIIKSSPDATRDVASDPQLGQLWQTWATSKKLDPQKDFNDSNARLALSDARNQLAGSLMLPTDTPIAPNQLSQGYNGSVVARNALTNLPNYALPPQPLEKVMGTNGPTLATAGNARGATPYDENTLALPQVESTAQAIAHYHQAPPTGRGATSGLNPAIMARVQQISQGETGAPYDATKFGTKQQARTDFGNGPAGDTVRSLSVATDHLELLRKAADAMKNGDVAAANSFVNFFNRNFGYTSVKDFRSMAEVVGDEVARAVGAGTLGGQEAVKKEWADTAASGQISSVIDKYQGLMGSQLEGFRRQYAQSVWPENPTAGSQDFNRFVSDLAQKKLPAANQKAGGGQPQPPGQPVSLDAYLKSKGY